MPKKLDAVQMDRQRADKYNKFKSITHKWWMRYEAFKNQKNYDWEGAIEKECLKEQATLTKWDKPPMDSQTTYASDYVDYRRTLCAPRRDTSPCCCDQIKLTR